MSSALNIHGLSRRIPADIRRQIRRDCGFGCVTCGMAVAQYEHIDPEFHDAREHDPIRIALLCGACHDKVTRGMWSKDKILNARKSPITFTRGATRDAFDLSGPISVMIGTNEFRDFKSIIRTRQGEDWLRVDPPEIKGGAFQLSGVFYSNDGTVSLEIERNDWWCPTNVWDLEISGASLTVRRGPGEIAVKLRAAPPGQLIVERINMVKGVMSLEVNAQGVATLRKATCFVTMEHSSAMSADSVFLL